MSPGVDERATDAELVMLFRQDPEQFERVYDRYRRDIYLHVAGRLDVQAADDVVAETFLTAFDQRDRFDCERGGLRPWLFGIATNLVARHLRFRTSSRYNAEVVINPATSRVHKTNYLIPPEGGEYMAADSGAFTLTTEWTNTLPQ